MSVLGNKLFQSIENIMIECGVSKKYSEFLTYKIQWFLFGVLLLEVISSLLLSELYGLKLSEIAAKYNISESYLMLPFWLIIVYPVSLIFIVLPILKLRSKSKHGD